MTRIVKQKFQWFFDMSTNTTTAQLLEIKAGGKDIVSRLLPFFQAYKNYKLGNVSVRMVPAATLPVDPTGLSLEAGESTVDPRDLFNPGLVRITNGEDNKLTQAEVGAPVSPAWKVSDGTYYATMLDPRWYKFRLQNGFKRSATPRFWGVGQIHQDMFPGHITNIPMQNAGGGLSVAEDIQYANAGTPPTLEDVSVAGSSEYGFFQTGQKIRMGWLPTQSYTDYMAEYEGTPEMNHASTVNNCPEIPLISCILPKAYKTLFYYRVYVTETVLFKDPVAINPYLSSSNYFQPVDVPLGVGKPVVSGLYGNTAYDFATNDNDGSGA